MNKILFFLFLFFKCHFDVFLHFKFTFEYTRVDKVKVDVS